MKKITQLALGALMLAGVAGGAAAPAEARSHISIGIGLGSPYGPGYYPPGPCSRYDRYYDGDCGYDAYDDRVYIDGDWYSGRHYYRHHHNRPEVWFRGGWHADYRGGWRDRDDRDWDRGRDHHRDRHHDRDDHHGRDHW